VIEGNFISPGHNAAFSQETLGDWRAIHESMAPYFNMTLNSVLY